MRRLRDAGLGIAADLGLGVVHARGSVESSDGLLELRRFAEERGGLIIFERMPDAWRDEVDAFGVGDPAAALAARIKLRFDPANILNPGRFQFPGRIEDGV